jgi:hypothetical protein
MVFKQIGWFSQEFYCIPFLLYHPFAVINIPRLRMLVLHIDLFTCRISINHSKVQVSY